MQEEQRFEQRYQALFNSLGAVQTIFPHEAKMQMAHMLEEATRRSQNLHGIASTQQTAAVKAGFAAEEVLSETYNHDAILRGSANRALTDRDAAFPGQFNDPSSDIGIIDADGHIQHSAQVKIYKDSATTRDQMGLLDRHTGQPKYANEDALIGPRDQINPTDGRPSVADRARVKAQVESTKRPEVARSMRDVEHKSTDRLSTEDGTAGRGFDKKQYEDLGQQNQKGRQQREQYLDQYRTQSTFQQMGKAAVGAATITAVSAGVYNTLIYVRAVREGRMSADEAAIKIVAETGASAADCALKASVNTGVQSTMVRYGGQKALQTTLMRSTAGGLMRTSAVTVAVIGAIDLAKNLVLLSAGKISQAEFEERSGKSLLNTGAGVYGGAVGAMVGTPFFPPIGTYVGSVLGAMVSGFAMQFAIENGLEKPFRQAVEDTQQVKEAMAEFERMAGNMLAGQLLFQHYLQEEARLDAEFKRQQHRLDDLGHGMKSAIDRL